MAGALFHHYLVSPGNESYSTKIETCRITRVADDRIYFVSDGVEGWADRSELETTGRAEMNGDLRDTSLDPYIYARPPIVASVDMDEPSDVDTPAGRLAKLRRAMIAAHPDQGGTAETFWVARERYMRAKGLRP